MTTDLQIIGRISLFRGTQDAIDTSSGIDIETTVESPRDLQEVLGMLRQGERRVDPVSTRAWLNLGLDSGQFVGAQVTCRIGTRRFDLAVGEAVPGRPMTPSTCVPWLCAGKPILAAAAHLLGDRGVIDIDAPIGQWFPAMAVTTAIRTLTVRDLLAQSTGLHQSEPPASAGIPDRASKIRQALSATQVADWTPDRRGYSESLAAVLLAVVLETATGSDITDLVEECILQPLTMKSSSLNNATQLDNRACLYLMTEGNSAPLTYLTSRRFAEEWKPGSNWWGPISELAVFLDAASPRLPTVHTPLGRALRHTLSNPSLVIDEYFNEPIYHSLGFMSDLTWRLGEGRVSSSSYGCAGAGFVLAVADPSRDLTFGVFFNGQQKITHVTDTNPKFMALFDQCVADLTR